MAKDGNTAGINQRKRNDKGNQTERQHAVLVPPHALHVHLQRGQKHDIVESHIAEKFKRVVTIQDVQSVLTQQHACEYHADDVRNAQLAHDDGCQ